VDKDNPTRTSDAFREKGAAIRDDLRDLGRLTRDTAQEKLEEAREAAGQYLEEGRKRAGEIEDQIEKYVREKPLQAVLMAAGAGMLLGFLLRRR
jgi:ElaB/YqjD/DUF883 family membrane-anchored ribosome-binding protein